MTITNHPLHRSVRASADASCSVFAARCCHLARIGLCALPQNTATTVWLSRSGVPAKDPGNPELKDINVDAFRGQPPTPSLEGTDRAQQGTNTAKLSKITTTQNDENRARAK